MGHVSLNVPGRMRSFVRPLARAIRDHVLPRALPVPRADRVLRGDPRTVRVVGLLSSATGLGNSARLCAQDLELRGYSVRTHDVAPLFGCADGVPYAQGEPAAGAEAAISVYHLNPPMLLPGIVSAGIPGYYGALNVAYWAWELESLPADWITALDFLDALIVPSHFCREAVSRVTDKPVCVVPHPLRIAPARPRKGPTAVFTVLSVFNFGSSFQRKNPLAAIAAFREAFGADPSARLILKTSAGNRYGHELAQLRAAAQNAGNIEIVDAVMSETELYALYARADAYLSLHRSEGFGLPIAEAMMLGCPVVTTAWSGNLDFCTDETSLLVPFDLIPFADTDRAYARVRGGRWAEPDVLAAARQLRRLRVEPELGRRLAARGRQMLCEHIAQNEYATALRGLFGSGL